MPKTVTTIRATWALVGVAVVAAVLYQLTYGSTVAIVTFVVTALASLVAVVVGPRLHRPKPSRPWTVLAIAIAMLVLGVAVRPWCATRSDWASSITDGFTMTGYMLVLISLVLMLKSAGGLERHAVADSVVVSIGVGMVCTVTLVLPTTAIAGRPQWLSLLAGVYPVVDVLLLIVMLQLAFARRPTSAAFTLLTVAFGFLLSGDLAYALVGTRGVIVAGPLPDLPYFGALAGIGAAALHPSMVELAGSRGSRPVQAWSWPRLAMLTPALMVPFVLLAFDFSLSTLDRVVIGVLGACMVAALLLRAVSAVNDHTQAERVLRHQATHDSLTDLPNRVLLTDRLEEMLAVNGEQGPALWLMFLDLDGFKLVNDSWGHEAGDQLIVDIARRLRAHLPGDVLVARVSGDEFAVCLWATAVRADELAHQVLRLISQPVRLGGGPLVVSASLGMVAAEDDSTSDTLLRDADTAMYRAKNAGRARVVMFDASMRASVRNRIEIETALRYAVASGQLWLAYQPIVDLATERVLGCEALLRWNHPERGPIAPTDFIPVAEETGLIVDIGRFVLRQALQQTSAWANLPGVDADFFVSVNVSARQMADRHLLDLVPQTLAITGLASKRIILEITESLMISSGDVAEEVLLGLAGQGVRLSVDDFGTGFSALGYLQRFPVDEVKIDRSFVSGLGRDPDDEAIVRAVAAMADALRLASTAEGVETQIQADMLRGLGVGKAQGFLFGRPVSAAEFQASYLPINPCTGAVEPPRTVTTLPVEARAIDARALDARALDPASLSTAQATVTAAVRSTLRQR